MYPKCCGSKSRRALGNRRRMSGAATSSPHDIRRRDASVVQRGGDKNAIDADVKQTPHIINIAYAAADTEFGVGKRPPQFGTQELRADAFAHADIRQIEHD